MRGTKKRIRLCTCLLCLTLIFIWGNSMMPGAVSERFSRWIGELFGGMGIPVNESEDGHGLLRKLAHFSEFACLGLLLCWRIGMAGEKGKQLVRLTLAGALTAACVDETIQVFTPDRGSSLIDVWIDTSGAAVGMIFLILGHYLIRTKHGKKILEETT